MDWTLAKNQGPGIAHTVCRALEDSYFATSSTLAGLAFTCRPTKSVYFHNSFIASYYFTICSCKVARCNICKPFARIVSVWQGDVVSQVLHLGISDIWSVWSVTRPTWYLSNGMILLHSATSAHIFWSHLPKPANRNQQAGTWHP